MMLSELWVVFIVDICLYAGRERRFLEEKSRCVGQSNFLMSAIYVLYCVQS